MQLEDAHDTLALHFGWGCTSAWHTCANQHGTSGRNQWFRAEADLTSLAVACHTRQTVVTRLLRRNTDCKKSWCGSCNDFPWLHKAVLRALLKQILHDAV